MSSPSTEPGVETLAPPPVGGATLLGRFRLLDEIGRGGHSVVYEAIRTSTGERVALKVLIQREPRRAREAVRRMKREGALLWRLQGHPGIVRVVEAGEDTVGAPYIAMERLVGRTLSEALQREGSLPIEVARELGLQLLSALDAVHEVGVVHRDVKPSNLFLAQEQSGAAGDGLAGPPRLALKLLDFGLATGLDPRSERLTGQDEWVGTVPYASPERLVSWSMVDQRADLYAVGAVLFRCLTGQTPYEGSRKALIEAALTAPVPSARALRADVPIAFDAVIARALAKRPADRYPDAPAMAAALSALPPTSC